ncbi:DHA2 family efflux MFS transporter permease subunit [Brevibacillus sp. SYSU BS000544]|uniref:DHA2 family efflux MFS transporter permease subunit n=1 Tax=Brevibacillus sp. SYSU BS000544 TaxID=3416443 RepID=UPI003CE4AD65
MSQQVENQTVKEENSSQKWLALIAIIMGTFVSVLNNSLINVALPELVTVFGSTTEVIQWVLTGFMLASAVVIPLSGYLGDRFGYKKVFLGSLIAFVLGSLLCGFAWNDTSIIIFRIVQGVGGGLIMPVGMAIIYMLIPRHQIGMALGIWGVAAMVAPAVGPTLSGYLIEYFSWRLLFFMNVPVGIISVIFGMILLKETPIKENLKFDFPGAILSIIGFGTLLYALSKGQSEGWDSFMIVSFLIVAFFSLVLLVIVELGTDQPVLDVRFFKNPIFAISTLTSGLVMIGMFGGVFLVPLYLQNIQGLTPIDTGLLLMPQSIAMAFMMPISGKLFDKFGVVPLGLVGISILGITTYELHMLTQQTPNHWLNTILTIRGLGIGLCMMPLTTVGMATIAKEQVGRASSVSNVIRQVMASFGIAILTTIMTQRQNYHVAQINDSVTSTNIWATDFISTLTGLYGQYGVDAITGRGFASQILGGLIVKEAAVRAIADTFVASAIPVFLCLPLLFLLRKRKESV